LSDWLCKKLTKVNNRVYEPEFRLALVVFQLIGAAVGLFPFGISIDQHWSYYVSIMLFGFVTFALIMGATATGTYIVDAHLNMAVEAFVCITLFKNFVSFGMTLHVFDFLQRLGNTKVCLG
jgi:VIT1/CCC1 family predicted Fe2+/Mn2+ transporter